MAVPTLAGLVDDQDILQNERVIDMDEEIALLDPDSSQFTTMLMRVARTEAISTKNEWLEDEYFPRLSSVASGGATNGAAIVVAAGEGVYFRAGDLVRNARTGNAVRVISIATDTLTVSVALGRVAFAAAAAADQLLITGHAAAQGATLGTRKITKRVAQFNYQQIQRNPYGFTRSLMASKLYGGPVPEKERRKKFVEHKRAIEYTLFWGVRNLDTATFTEPIGMCGGVFEFVTTLVKNAAGNLTKVLLDQYMRDFLQHGGEAGASVLFVSPVVAAAISGFLRDAWNPADDVAKGSPRLWGAQVDGFISGAYGFKVPVVVKRDWNDFSTTSGQYGGWAFYVNMNSVSMPILRKTELLRDRQAPDADTADEEYLTEFGLRLEHERKNGIITGVTG